MAGRYLVITENEGNTPVTEKALKTLLQENDYSVKSADIDQMIEDGTTLRTVEGKRFWIDETYKGGTT